MSSPLGNEALVAAPFVSPPATGGEVVVLHGDGLPVRGETELDESLIREAVLHLNAVVEQSRLQLACRIGAYVLERFFGGKAENFRSRARRHASFRALSEHEDLQLGCTLLWRAVNVYDQLDLLPKEVVGALSYTHHTLLLPLSDAGEKVALARLAVEKGWSSDQLYAAVHQKRKGGRKVGRPSTPSIVRRVQRLEALVGEDWSSELDSYAELDDVDQRRLLRSVQRLVRRLEVLQDELRPVTSGTDTD